MDVMAKAHLKEQDSKAVQEAVRRLRERFPVQEVILFGSKERGEDDDISDIDLLILTNRPLEWQEKDAIVGLLFDVGMEFDVLFDPTIHSEEEWNNGLCRYFPLREAIQVEGIPLASHD